MSQLRLSLCVACPLKEFSIYLTCSHLCSRRDSSACFPYFCFLLHGFSMNSYSSCLAIEYLRIMLFSADIDYERMKLLQSGFNFNVPEKLFKTPEKVIQELKCSVWLELMIVNRRKRCIICMHFRQLQGWRGSYWFTNFFPKFSGFFQPSFPPFARVLTPLF